MSRAIILFVFFFSLIYSAVDAQTVNGVPIESIGAEYLQITPHHKFLIPIVELDVDYGQKRNSLYSKDYLLDDKGKIMEFQSKMHALNYFADLGYEFVETIVDVTSDGSITRFLFRKAKMSESNNLKELKYL